MVCIMPFFCFFVFALFVLYFQKIPSKKRLKSVLLRLQKTCSNVLYECECMRVNITKFQSWTGHSLDTDRIFVFLLIGFLFFLFFSELCE